MITLSSEQSRPTTDEDAVLSDIVRALTQRLGDRVDVRTVEAEAERALAHYRDARIRQFVPILVQRDVLVELASRPGTAGSAVSLP